jgi:hypothetical protein
VFDQRPAALREFGPGRAIVHFSAAETEADLLLTWTFSK